MRVAKVSQEEKIALFFSEAANTAITEKKWIENGFAMSRNLFQAVILLHASKMFKVSNACSKKLPRGENGFIPPWDWKYGLNWKEINWEWFHNV